MRGKQGTSVLNISAFEFDIICYLCIICSHTALDLSLSCPTVQAVALQLPGDLGQGERQREPAVPGAAQPGQEPHHDGPPGRPRPLRHGLAPAQGEVPADVAPPLAPAERSGGLLDSPSAHRS